MIDNSFFNKEDVISMPAEIYKRPCAHCPSMLGGDPESDDIRTWDRDLQLGLLFVCAWRKKKLCHGLCKAGGFTKADVIDFKKRMLDD